VKQEQSESHEEKKAGEIVALVEAQRAERHPMAEKKNHGERDDSEFEKESREGWEGRGARLGRNFAAQCFAEKRPRKEHDAAEAKNAAENIGTGRNDCAAGKMENAGCPVLDSCGNGGGEEHADVRVAGDHREFDGWIRVRGDEIGGVRYQAGELILAGEDERIELNRRRNEVKKIFSGDAMRGLHGRGGNGDNACGAKLGSDAQSDVGPHRVAHKDGVIWKEQPASGEATREGTRARLGLVGRKGAVGAAVAGEIRDVDGQALHGKAARQIGHDDLVGGEAMKENDSAALGIFGNAGLLDDVHGEWAGAGVHQVVANREAARGIEGESRADEDEKNTGGSEKAFFVFHVEGRLRELGLERA